MNLYSLKVQTLVARWKHFRSSSSAIFVDDHSYATGAVLRVRTQEEARAVIRAGKFLSTRPTARIWHLQTFISSPKRKKKNLCAKRFKSHADVKHEVQTWLRSQDTTFYRQDFEKCISCLDKCLNREGDCVGK